MYGPICVRYPRGKSNEFECASNETLTIGKGNVVKQGKKIAILSFGTMLEQSLIAAEKLNATVVDMRFVKPLDEALIIELASSHKQFISIEDNVITGGAGSAISEFLHQKQISMPLSILGLPDQFTEQGSQEELYALYGLNAKGIINAADS